MEVPLDYALTWEGAKRDFMTNESVPVLQEAAGALGVLRAMEIHRQGIQKRMFLDGGQHRILHLVFHEEGGELCATIHSYTFIVHKEFANA